MLRITPTHPTHLTPLTHPTPCSIFHMCLVTAIEMTKSLFTFTVVAPVEMFLARARSCPMIPEGKEQRGLFRPDPALPLLENFICMIFRRRTLRQIYHINTIHTLIMPLMLPPARMWTMAMKRRRACMSWNLQSREATACLELQRRNITSTCGR